MNGKDTNHNQEMNPEQVQNLDLAAADWAPDAEARTESQASDPSSEKTPEEVRADEQLMTAAEAPAEGEPEAAVEAQAEQIADEPAELTADAQDADETAEEVAQTLETAPSIEAEPSLETESTGVEARAETFEQPESVEVVAAPTAEEPARAPASFSEAQAPAESDETPELTTEAEPMVQAEPLATPAELRMAEEEAADLMDSGELSEREELEAAADPEEFVPAAMDAEEEDPVTGVIGPEKDEESTGLSADADEVAAESAADEEDAPAPRQQVTFIPDPFMITLDGSEPTDDEILAEGETSGEESLDAAGQDETTVTDESAEASPNEAAFEAVEVVQAAPESEAAEGTDDSEQALEAADMSDDEDEVIDFDQDPEAVEAELSRYAEAMQKEQDRLEEELKAVAEAEEEFDAEAELAAQIAEDEALQRELEAEAEQAEQLDPELQAALPKMPEEDEEGNWEVAEVQSCIEALLFMSDKPMSMAKLREHLGPDFPKEIFEQALQGLEARYAKSFHGIELVKVAGGYQFRTKPIRAPLARKLAKVQSQKLSRGAMETLAIIAYRQPVMKEDVDQIRGVDSSHFIRGLLDKKLIKICGRSELPGRPMLYDTTQDFLEIFGLNNLDDMPPLRELESMVPSSESGNPEDEDPKVREMRRLVQEMKSSKERLDYDPKEDEKFLKDIRDRVKSIPATTPYIETKERIDKALASGELPEGEVQDALEIVYQAAEARRAEESIADEAAAAMVAESAAGDSAEELELSADSADGASDDADFSAAEDAAAAMVADTLAAAEESDEFAEEKED